MIKNNKRISAALAILAVLLLIIAIVLVSILFRSVKEESAVSVAEPAMMLITDNGEQENTVARNSMIVNQYYTTEDYFFKSGEKYNKNMMLYLPPYYDRNSKYDVIFLMHGAGCDEKFWLGLGIKDVLDELILNNKIEPVIAVMLSGYINSEASTEHNSSRDYPQFAAEFRDDIIPIIKKEYAVYEEREHYAFCGVSFGAYMTVNSILIPNLDIISKFGYIGGGKIDITRIENGWAETGTTNLDISNFYIGEGEYDDRGPVERTYKDLLYNCSKFNSGNLKFSLIEGAGHDETEWITGTKEALLYFFPIEKLTE